MIEILGVVGQQLSDVLGLNYEFGRMTQSPPRYPYWVGDYTEPEPLTEDGLEEPTIILTGFSRGLHLTLEADKQHIKDHFKTGVSVITESGNAVVVFYAGSFNIPIDEGDLKKAQVNLRVKAWTKG